MAKAPKMTSLAYTREEKKERNKSMGGAPTDIGPDYPWGLELRLECEALEKLKRDDDLPSVGDALHLAVIAKVTSVRAEEREHGEGQKCVGLQVTHLCILDEGAEDNESGGKSRAPQRPPKTLATYYGEGREDE